MNRAKIHLHRALSLGLLMCLPGVMVRAEERAKSTPPSDLPVRPIPVLTTVRETLPNGLRIVICKNSRVPLVTATLGIPAGQSETNSKMATMEDIVQTLIEQGSKKYDEKQFAGAVKKIGGSVTFAAEKDYAKVQGDAVASKTPELLALMAEKVLRPKFDPRIMEAYLSQLKRRAEIFARALDEGVIDDKFDARARLMKVIYGSHPYAFTEVNLETAHNLSPDTVLDFYEKHYRPNGSLLLIVGDVNPAETMAQIKTSLLGTWKRVSPPAVKPIQNPSYELFNRVFLLNRPKAVQSKVSIGNAIPKDIPAKDAMAIEVANAVIGGKIDSRLFNVIREKLGYAYDVHSSVSLDSLAGTFNIGVESRTSVTGKAIKRILKEVEDLQNKPISAEELQGAKNYLGGKLLKSLTHQSTLASELFEMEYFHRPADWLTGYRERLNSVTIDDVQRAAKKYLLPGRAAIVVQGDAGKLSEELAEIGTMEKND